MADVSTPTVAELRALLRSNSERFGSLHFTFRRHDGREDVEAWLTRPATLKVRTPGGEEHHVRDAGVAPDGTPEDPMWQSYDWVAALRPRELAGGVDYANLAETVRHGRRTWWATMTPRDDYDPRCTCCPLLWGEVSERLLTAGSGPTYAALHPDVDYPASWLVGVDAQTGVVVSTEPLGGSRLDAGIWIDIHDVDHPGGP